MKGFVLFLLLILTLSPLSSEEKDIVIMVDISASVDPYFHEMIEYLRTDLLKGKLDRGNMLHLLSFSGIPEMELTVPIYDDADRTRIFTKLTFLQPIGLYTDLVSAIKFLITYSDNLPQSLRAKEIFLLTDGIHDPPPGSIYDIDSDDVLTALLTSAESIKKRGWAVHIFQMPLSEAYEGKDRPASTAVKPAEGKSYLDELGKALETSVLPHPDAWQSKLEEQEKVESKAIESEAYQKDVSRKPDQERPDKDRSGKRESTLKKSVRILIIVGLTILAFTLLIFLLFILYKKRRLRMQMNRYMQPGKPSPKSLSGKRGVLIEMRVAMQNHHIGFRNIHAIEKNKHKTVGGGLSRYLIFLVPVPSHIAEIHYDGESYMFKRIKKSFFPELHDDVPDCLDKDIPAQSKKGFPLTLRFHRYVSPLEEINRILTLTLQNRS